VLFPSFIMARQFPLLNLFISIVTIHFCLQSIVLGKPLKRKAPAFVSYNSQGQSVFELGDTQYLANVKHPKATVMGDCTSVAPSDLVLFTIIRIEKPTLTADDLKNIISTYSTTDDVFTIDFLDGIYIQSSTTSVLDQSAADYLSSLQIRHLVLDNSITNNARASFKVISAPLYGQSLPPGPYVVSASTDKMQFAMVYRLYRDEYRDFLYGTHDSNDAKGTHLSVGLFETRFWDPLIPYVPKSACPTSLSITNGSQRPLPPLQHR
jgi:hypothetical protein